VRRIYFRVHFDLIIYLNKADWILGIASNISLSSLLIYYPLLHS